MRQIEEEVRRGPERVTLWHYRPRRRWRREARLSARLRRVPSMILTGGLSRSCTPRIVLIAQDAITDTDEEALEEILPATAGRTRGFARLFLTGRKLLPNNSPLGVGAGPRLCFGK